MLPSKGFFSTYSCPFFESGECLRPYCHFRHKKDKIDATNEISPREPNRAVESNVEIVQDVVNTKAKALPESKPKDTMSYLNSSSIEPNVDDLKTAEVPSYKPTPIAELNKRHIPVIYAPTKPEVPVRKNKESLVYLPKNLKVSKNAYVPLSTASANNNYTYEPSKINKTTYSIKECKALLNEDALDNIEEKQIALNRLLEEDFGTDENNVETNNNDDYDEVHTKEDPADVNEKGNLSCMETSALDDAPPILDKTAESKAKENITENIKETELVDKKIKTHEVTKSRSHSDSSSHKSRKKDDKHSKSTHSSHHKSKSRSKSSEDKNKSSSSHKVQEKDRANDNSNNKLLSDKDRSRSSSKHSSSSSSTEKKHKSKSEKGDKCKTEKDDKVKVEKHEKLDNKDSKSKQKSSKNHKSSSSSHHSREGSSSKHRSSSHSSSCSKTSKTEEVICPAKTEMNLTSKQPDLKKQTSHVSSNKEEKNTKHDSLSLSSKMNVQSDTESKKHSEKSKNYMVDKAKPVDKTKSSMPNENSSHKSCRKRSKSARKYESDSEEVVEHSLPKFTRIEISSDEEEKSENSEGEESSSSVQEVIVQEDPIDVIHVIDSSSNSSYSQEMMEAESDSNSRSLSPPPEKKQKSSTDFENPSSQAILQSMLCERWRKARETILMKSSAPGKVKIAQVPNVSSLLTAKNELIAQAQKKPQPSYRIPSTGRESSPEEYIPKPKERVAKISKLALAGYPNLKMEENLRIPNSIRQKCLNNIYDELIKFISPENANEKAVEIELDICRRTHMIKTYQNSCAMAVLKIRKNKGLSASEERVNKEKLESDSVPEYTYGWTIYQCFSKYLMAKDELAAHGFPIPLDSPNGNNGYIEKSARWYSAKQQQQPDEEGIRICANCSKEYYVDKKGFPLDENNCFYHWGRLRRVRTTGNITEVYICCGGDIGSEPCSSGRYHVCNLYDEDCLEGFVKTRPMKNCETPDKAGIFGLDCEMCYTTKGLDLTRVTLVDLNGNSVYDELVLPEHPILDYCTRFSGVTEGLMKKAKLKLRDVQKQLLKFINEKTIIVGHSLDNDFKALRLFHYSVVDTSVVFPHQLGLPYKMPLKRLAKEILNLSIQDKESGHDSCEDAQTCIKIMMHKIKEDAKERRPRVIISLDSKGSHR